MRENPGRMKPSGPRLLSNSLGRARENTGQWKSDWLMPSKAWISENATMRLSSHEWPFSAELSKRRYTASVVSGHSANQ